MGVRAYKDTGFVYRLIITYTDGTQRFEGPYSTKQAASQVRTRYIQDIYVPVNITIEQAETKWKEIKNA